jgi:hypothetical protein
MLGTVLASLWSHKTKNGELIIQVERKKTGTGFSNCLFQLTRLAKNGGDRQASQLNDKRNYIHGFYVKKRER